MSGLKGIQRKKRLSLRFSIPPVPFALPVFAGVRSHAGRIYTISYQTFGVTLFRGFILPLI